MGSADQAWQAIATAPFGRELELAVIDEDGVHALVFACRRSPAGWTRESGRDRVEVSPTHWREWNGARR